MRVTGLVRDHSNRLSWLKALTLAGCIAPAVVILAQWYAGALGSRPINEAIHQTGLWTVRLLVISLAVSPLRVLLEWSRLLLIRRIVGVATACYAIAHLILFAYDQKWDPLKVVSEIALRFYLTVGFVALVGLMVLAVTSTDDWQRRLGPGWRKLHKTVYLIGALALYHYGVQSKADISGAVFLTGLFIWLMLWRLEKRRWQPKLWPLSLLAVGAGVAAAVFEAAWYALRNNINPMRVLISNASFAFGPRPAVMVAMVGVTVIAVVAFRRWSKRRPFPTGGMRRA